MIKANKEGQRKTPILRFKGFTDDWEQRKLSDFAHIIVGGTPSTKKNEYWNGNIPWMSSGEINKKRIYKTDKSITKLGLENSSAKFVPENSVLIALAGQGKTRGKVAVNNIELTINQSLAGLIPTSGSYYEFIFYNLEKRYSELRRLSSGAGSRGGLNKKLIQNIKVQIPNLREQTLISKLSETLDKVLTLYERKLKLLSQVKKYFLDNLFAEKEYPNLRFKGFTDAWEQRELREIAKKRTEKNRNLLTSNVLSNSAIYGIVKQTEYFNKSIANNIQNYYLVYENDFVYNPRISNNAPFGPISRNKLNELGVISPLYLVFYFSTKSLSDYLEIYFKSSKWHKFMYMSGNSGARSDRFAIKDNDFFRMKIKMPHSKDEINKIYKFNILLYKLFTLYENKQQYLTEIKNTLLNTMFI